MRHTLMSGGGPMRPARRERAARRQIARALDWSEDGRHAWAINAANDAVELWRPVAAQHPAAMARALATRARCLHLRGRIAEAAWDVAECLEYRERAHGPASWDDLAHVAMQLDRSGHADEALALVDQLLAEAPAHSDPRLAAPMAARGFVLWRHGRAGDAVDALREAYAIVPPLSTWLIRTSIMLFEVLAAAGRYEELQEHAQRDLWMFAFISWGSPRDRSRYIALLEILERHHIASPRLPRPGAAIQRQRRKLARQLRRRQVLVTAVAALGVRRRVPPETEELRGDEL